MQKTLKLDFPQYCGGHYIYVIFTDDIHATLEDLDEEHDLCVDISQLPVGVTAVTVYAEDTFDTVIVFNLRPTAGTIAHESYHALKRLFRLIRAEKEDEEVFAHHLGYLVSEIHKAIPNDKGN